MIRQDEYLGILVSFFDLLIDQKTIIGFIDLSEKQEIGRSAALQTQDMRVVEITLVLLVVDLGIARPIGDAGALETHLIQNILFGGIFGDVVHLGATETGLRKTRGVHRNVLYGRDLLSLYIKFKNPPLLYDIVSS
jgi:hypothetical protein